MTAMLIRCLQKRKGGSDIKMNDGKTVAFRPDENDDHIAMVADPEHIQRLLSITEGFKIHTAGNTTPAAKQKAVIADAVKKIIAEKDISGDDLGDVTTSIVEQAAIVEPDPADPQTTPSDTEGAARPLKDMTEDDLRAVFVAEVGRAPHHKSKTETIIAQIEAIREENKAK
jgi:hypothetical protein